MCLENPTSNPANPTFAKIRREKSGTYYKVYRKENGTLAPVVFALTGPVRAGKITSNRRRRPVLKCEQENKEVERGIHVLATRKAAEIEAGMWRPWIKFHTLARLVIVEVTGKFKDLVAVGSYDRWRSLVFMSVELSEEEYRKAIA